MYTRNVSLKLKANSALEFTRTLENEVIPVMRKQKGFRDEITLVAPERNEAVAISFWDRKEDAEALINTRDIYERHIFAFTGRINRSLTVAKSGFTPLISSS